MKASRKYRIRKMFEAYENERLTGSTIEEYYEVLMSIMKRIFGKTWKLTFDGKDE